MWARSLGLRVGRVWGRRPELEVCSKPKNGALPHQSAVLLNPGCDSDPKSANPQRMRYGELGELLKNPNRLRIGPSSTLIFPRPKSETAGQAYGRSGQGTACDTGVRQRSKGNRGLHTGWHEIVTWTNKKHSCAGLLTTEMHAIDRLSLGISLKVRLACHFTTGRWWENRKRAAENSTVGPATS